MSGELNLTHLLPQTVTVVLGEKRYTATNDIAPALSARAVEFIKQWGELLDGTGEHPDIDVEPGWDIAAEIIGVSKEELRPIGFAALVQLLAFFTDPMRAIKLGTIQSSMLSTSPAPSKEPSTS